MIVSHELVKFTETVTIRPIKFECFFAVAKLNDGKMLNKFPTIKNANILKPTRDVSRSVSLERPIFRKYLKKRCQKSRPLLRFDRHSDLSPDQQQNNNQKLAPRKYPPTFAQEFNIHTQQVVSYLFYFTHELIAKSIVWPHWCSFLVQILNPENHIFQISSYLHFGGLQISRINSREDKSFVTHSPNFMQFPLIFTIPHMLPEIGKSNTF